MESRLLAFVSILNSPHSGCENCIKASTSRIEAATAHIEDETVHIEVAKAHMSPVTIYIEVAIA